MGNQWATPGKATAIHDPTFAATEIAVATPGKTSLVDQQLAAGDAAIAAGGLGSCSTLAGPGCFLQPLQRIELNAQARVLMVEAHKNYDRAIDQLKVAEMIKRSTELPWYLVMLLGACGSLLELAASAAVRGLKQAGAAASAVHGLERSAGGAAKESGRAVKEAEGALAMLASQQLQTAIKSSVAIAKDKAKGALAGVTSGESREANQKTQALGYLDLLSNHSAVVFQVLQLQLGTLTDAEALAMRDAFDARYHTADLYQAQLGAALRRYKDSHVSEMGRSMDWGGRRVEREIRIARILVPGAGARYAYMDRLFDGWYQTDQAAHRGTVERSPAYDSPQHALSLDQPASWTVNGEEVTRRETPLRPDGLLSFVEPEFLDLALEKQAAIWLTGPETFQLVYTASGPRLVKVAGG